jgi:hypothetical protein
MTENSGISISGNANVTAGAMAAGPHAKAESHQYDSGALAQVREQLHDVLAQLAELTADTPDRHEAEQTGRELEEELSNDPPDPGKVRALWERLKDAAGPIESLSASIASIQQSIQPLL